MATQPTQHSLTFRLLPVAVGALLVLGALLAGPVLAESGDMSGMPGMTNEEMPGMTHEEGMTDEEMQGMEAPGDADSVAPAADGHATEAATDPHGGMDMGGASGVASVNWFVIGGFIILIGGSTLAAVATNHYLRSRNLTVTGKLATAEAQDV